MIHVTKIFHAWTKQNLVDSDMKKFCAKYIVMCSKGKIIVFLVPTFLMFFESCTSESHNLNMKHFHPRISIPQNMRKKWSSYVTKMLHEYLSFLSNTSPDIAQKIKFCWAKTGKVRKYQQHTESSRYFYLAIKSQTNRMWREEVCFLFSNLHNRIVASFL